MTSKPEVIEHAWLVRVTGLVSGYAVWDLGIQWRNSAKFNGTLEMRKRQREICRKAQFGFAVSLGHLHAYQTISEVQATSMATKNR